MLVVEDDAGQRNLLHLALSAAEMDVLTVSDGIEAFEALRKQDYRAILCDVRMPRQNGFTFYDQLQEILPHLAGRVVFLTAYTGDPEVRAYIERTGQPVIHKPYRIKQLLDTLNRTIAKPFHA